MGRDDIARHRKIRAAKACQAVPALFGFHEFRFGVTSMGGNWSI